MKSLTVVTGSIGTASASGVLGSSVPVAGENAHVLSIVTTAITAGATLVVEARASTRDGAGSWFPILQLPITANGRLAVPVLASKMRHITRGKTFEEWRVNVVSYTDGSHICESHKITQ